MPLDANTFSKRLTNIRQQIEDACSACGRRAIDVQLLPVSKRFPVDHIEVAYAQGLRDFGENYLTELAEKVSQLPKDITWHVIGPVQRRAVAKLPGTRYVVQSLDRIEVFSRWEQVFGPGQATYFLQVNIGEEPQKSGILPANVYAFLDDLQAAGGQVSGLMAIPPVGATSESRRHFAALRQLKEHVETRYALSDLELSMGMSGDFSEAIAEGATIVRLGTALFGPRS